MWGFPGRISIGTLPIEDMLWPVENFKMYDPESVYDHERAIRTILFWTEITWVSEQIPFLGIDRPCTVLMSGRLISRSFIYSDDRTVSHVIRDNSMPSWTTKSLRRIPKLINCVIRGHWIGIALRKKNFTLESFRARSHWSIWFSQIPRKINPHEIHSKDDQPMRCLENQP